MEQEEKQCNEVQTIREFTYQGDRVSAGRECEAVVTIRTRGGWVKFIYIWQVIVWKEVSSNVEVVCLQESCKSSNAVWK